MSADNAYKFERKCSNEHVIELFGRRKDIIRNLMILGYNPDIPSLKMLEDIIKSEPLL